MTNDSTIVPDGGVTSPKGFTAGGLHCGIRKSKRDLAIIYSAVPATVAGVFTTNKVVAAPVIVDRLQTRRNPNTRAIVVNSGVANACTGERGLNDAWTMVRVAAEALGVAEHEVLVSSTGVIGQYLPMEKIVPGIRALAPLLSNNGAHNAAEAIMTTDTCAKEYAVMLDIDGVMVTIGAVAKGSGMICPNMATMLGFVTTDVAIAQPLLQKVLRSANAESFNRISVDGDTSTNDMVLVMANGLAGNTPLTAGTQALDRFAQALEHVLISMAKMIARDGEGATKLIEVEVKGGASIIEAEQAARAIAGSSLVKTAIHGADANWGRIIAAVGYSGIEFDPANVAITLGDVPVLLPGYDIVIDEEKAKQALLGDDVIISVDLHRGNHTVRFWTCDLTKEYVHINASYRS